MLALGLVLNTVGIGLFCWLIFMLAAYALPFFVGLYVFMLALHSGAGVLGAPILGIAAGGITLAIGQIAFAMTRSVIIRAIIAALFAVPATLAGYQVVLRCRKSACHRWYGARSSPASVRSLLAARRGRG
jgi:hypothetical protein